MIKNDFLLRQIQETILFLVRLLFPRGITERERKEIRNTELYLALTDLIRAQKFSEAEDLLFEKAAEGGADAATGVFFYEDLLALGETKLRAGDFSVKEVESGLNDYMKLFHLRI